MIPVNGIFGTGGNVSRRRFQRGCVYLRGDLWVGRWREDEISAEGQTVRKLRYETLGSRKEYPTKRLAQRALEMKLAEVNSLSYRAKPTVTFGSFAKKWEETVLPHMKPSTQAAIRSQLRKWLVPCFSGVSLTNVSTEMLQGFVTGLTCSAKSTRNLVVTLRSMWKTARAWGLVTHDPFVGLVLPKRQRVEVRFFTADEMRRIIEAAAEPYKTFFWLAAETGMRAGELCGLRWEDVDEDSGIVQVRQSVWRGGVGTPKTPSGTRQFCISTALAARLRAYRGADITVSFVFHARTGSPWDANLLVKRKLHPILDRLGISPAGLHAFRHGNATVLDQAQVPMKVRQARLGHADAEMTAHYTHVVSADDQKAASELERVIFGGQAVHPTQTMDHRMEQPKAPGFNWQVPGGNA